MNETRKEKFIRFMLIGFFMFVTVYAFFLRYDKQPEIEDSDPIALVLKTSSSQTDDPIVALYENKNNDHILAVYKIERNNRYKFKTLHRIKLNNKLDQLFPDRFENGIWAHIDRKWIYLSESLKTVSRDPKYKGHDSQFKAAFVYNTDTSKILINNNQSINWDKGLGFPIEIHALTNDGLLWLVLTKAGISIGTVETK